MKPFDELLAEDISSYAGRHADLIALAPTFFQHLTGLLSDPELPKRLRPFIMGAIACFILPTDIFAESPPSPHGYIDDIFLAAFMADQVLWETGNEDLLIRHWKGTEPILPLLRKILAREAEMIGDQKWKILEYIGYQPLKH